MEVFKQVGGLRARWRAAWACHGLGVPGWTPVAGWVRRRSCHVRPRPMPALYSPPSHTPNIILIAADEKREPA